MPATLEDCAEIASSLPGVEERLRHGARTWFVGDKGFAWERGLSKADIKRFGDETPPDGPLFALRTEDLHEKEAILAAGQPGFFTIEHFNRYPAYLVQLKKVRKPALRRAILDAWLACAPPTLAQEYLGAQKNLGAKKNLATKKNLAAKKNLATKKATPARKRR